MPKMFKKKSKGFTLIELLVVITIIGILAAIVLVSLRGARSQAQDARIIADMGQLRSTAEIYYARNNNYANLCGDPDVQTLQQDISSQGAPVFSCNADNSTYCMEVQLKSSKWWCIDSALRSKQYSTDPACSSQQQNQKSCE